MNCQMALYELELRRSGLADERLYEGDPLVIDARVAIDDSIWRVVQLLASARPEARGRVVLHWEGWRRSELARSRAVALVEEATALTAESRLILKQVRAGQGRQAVPSAGHVATEGEVGRMRVGGGGAFRVFAVVRDAAVLDRLERVFTTAPDRQLVGVVADPDEALPLILAQAAHSVYIDVAESGADRLIARLGERWTGFIRPFTLGPEQTAVNGTTVVTFDDLAAVLESIYALKLEQGVESLTLDFQNLILDTLYQRGVDEAFLIMGYDGDVVFYAGRAARLGGLPYPPSAGLTEADVSHVIGRAYRREPVRSDDGRILAERFWIRLPRD